MLAAILRVPDLAVIGAGPDQALLDAGRSNGENHFPVKLSEIVPDDSSRRNDAAGILRREFRADYAPTDAAVGGPENHLASVVHGVVVERIKRQRRGPMAAVLRGVRLRIQRMQPGTDGARQFARMI